MKRLPITLADYFMGRDALYPDELTDDIREAARNLLPKVNRLLEKFYEANPAAVRRRVNSGWRPAAVNKATKNAAKKSKHLTGHAVDLSDDDEMLDRWTNSGAGKAAMMNCGLYKEHASATPRWAHFQDIPPASGKRIFYP